MITYPNNNVQGVGDQTVCRLLRIDNPTALTPRVLLKYIDEGFVPVYYESGGYAFVEMEHEVEGYEIETDAVYIAETLDTNFHKSE